MPEHNLVVPFTKFNNVIPIWMVAPEGMVILKNFEPHDDKYSPRKYKLLCGENAELTFAPVIFELRFIEEIKNYSPHYLGCKLDMVKTKCSVIAISSDDIEENNIIGFELCFSDLGGDGSKSIINPIPVFPSYMKIGNPVEAEKL